MHQAVESLVAKIREQIERTEHLLSLVPHDRLSWRPPAPAPTLSLEDLIGHLLDCTSGFCAVLLAVEPVRLAHFAALRDLPVNGPSNPAEASARLSVYRAHIDEGFAALTDEQLSRRIPTVFVAEGETMLTLLLGNLEHLLNHKFQLFFYLKMLGVPVGTSDLYQLRDVPPRPQA